MPENKISQKTEKRSFLPDVLHQNATKIMSGIALVLTIALISTCNRKNSDIKFLQSEKDSLLLANEQCFKEIKDLKETISWNSLDAKQKQDSLENVIQFQNAESERIRNYVLDHIYDVYVRNKSYLGVFGYEIESILQLTIWKYYSEEYKANPDSTYDAVKLKLEERRKSREEKLKNHQKENSKPKGKNQNTQRTTHK